MGKILIAYFTRTGNTETMARYMAEGVRIAGHEAEVRSVAEIGNKADLEGYDGYILGCPTFHLDMPEPFKAFLNTAGTADLASKIGGAFSLRVHPSSGDDSAAGLIFDTMESVFKMRMTELGPFDLKQEWLDTSKPEPLDTIEGMRACQDYGKAVAEMLG